MTRLFPKRAIVEKANRLLFDVMDFIQVLFGFAIAVAGFLTLAIFVLITLAPVAMAVVRWLK